MKYYDIIYIHKGKKLSKIVHAPSKDVALALSKKSIVGTILKVNITQPPVEILVKDFVNNIRLKRNKVNQDSLIVAVRQLALMTDAGISIHDAIIETHRSMHDVSLQNIFMTIDDSLNSGQSISQAVGEFERELGHIVLAMFKLGESTGDIARALRKLVFVLEEMKSNRSKFKKALRYPTMVVGTIITAFVVLITQVVPQFKTIFSELGAKLPVPTKILLFLENAFNTYGIYIAIFLVALIALIRYFYRHDEKFKYEVDAKLLKVYLIGNIIKLSTMGRFSLVLSELISAGISVEDSLKTAVGTVSNSHIKLKLESISVSIKNGIPFLDAFRITGMYNAILLQMIDAGEKTGRLDAMLVKVTEYFQEKFDNLVDNFASYIEPIILFALASMVLLLALGIFLPMWELSSAVNR